VTIQELETFLTRRFGLQVTPQDIQRAMMSRQLRSGVADAETYLDNLEENSTEATLLLDEFLIPESWFFRETSTLAAAVEELARTASGGPAGRKVRILSAPCSRGEEPLTLAILLLERGLQPDQFRIEAVDLSDAALAQARDGLYSSYSFRGVDDNVRDRYFSPHGQWWKVLPEIQRQVQYHHLNLIDGNLPNLRYDLICCRNLLIYLTQPAREQLFRMFHSVLEPGGHLVTAACEFALPPRELYTARLTPGACLHARKDETAAQPRLRGTALQGLATGTRRPRQRRAPAPATPPSPSPPTAPAARISPPPPKEAVPPLPEEFDDLDLAEQHANRGLLDQAEEFCARSLQQRGPTARGHYVMALLCGARKDFAEAEKHLRRALYLEPRYWEALVQLALYRERAGDLAEARRLRQRIRPGW
jgi:chemotaxis protein methyltransferase WspC